MGTGLGTTVQSYTSGHRFRLEELLGTGGYGRAFRGHRVDTRGHRIGEPVCIKVTEDQVTWHRESYFGELLAGQRRYVDLLDSFPRAVGSGSSRRVEFCLVFELAAHGDLDSYLYGHPTPWPEASIRREVAGLLDVLNLLHEAGAMHRDITPANVLVFPRRCLKLGDFGIARHKGGRQALPASAFNDGWVPLDIWGRGSWEPRDDVWQLGQVAALLVDPSAAAPIAPGDVSRLSCSDDMKVVIGRAIGPRRHRYDDALKMRAALGAGMPVRFERVSTLSGRTVVFTGKLSLPRARARALVIQAGGKVSESVGAGTDVLVCGNANKTYVAGTKGAKLMAAESLREKGHAIRVIDEESFLVLTQDGT